MKVCPRVPVPKGRHCSEVLHFDFDRRTRRPHRRCFVRGRRLPSQPGRCRFGRARISRRPPAGRAIHAHRSRPLRTRRQERTDGIRCRTSTHSPPRCLGAGIDASKQVVAYDQNSGMWASRLWWLLRWMGHDAVAVLDGGLDKWKAEGRRVTTAIPTACGSSATSSTISVPRKRRNDRVGRRNSAQRRRHDEDDNRPGRSRCRALSRRYRTDRSRRRTYSGRAQSSVHGQSRRRRASSNRRGCCAPNTLRSSAMSPLTTSYINADRA